MRVNEFSYPKLDRDRNIRFQCFRVDEITSVREEIEGEWRLEQRRY